MAPDSDPILSELLPFDEAVSKIKRARKTVFICVGTWAPFTVQNPAKQAAGYELGSLGLGAHVQVTRARAVEFLQDCFPAHWRPKLSIRIATSKRCMFIGSPPR